MIVGVVFFSRFDKWLNREVTEVFSVSQVDIRGFVPQWLLKRVVQTGVMRKFKAFEREAQAYEAELEKLKRQQEIELNGLLYASNITKLRIIEECANKDQGVISCLSNYNI